MIYIVLNALPILVAALLSLALGMLWYRNQRPATLATLFLAQAWLAAILAGALILAPPEAGVWTMTIGSAVVIWLGFVVPSVAATARLRGVVWRGIARDLGYWLVAMVAQALVMRLIGLTPPPA